MNVPSLLARWRLRKIVRLGVLAAIVVVAAVAGANVWVVVGAPAATADAASAPRADVGLVLGAGLNANGSPSGMLVDRLVFAERLYRSGRVGKLLVSGDHGTAHYDEVNAMRAWLVRRGVPDRAVFTDHAGFDTLDTMVRARRVFEVRSAVVITQRFHMARALWLGERAGLRVSGLVADRSGYGRQGRRARLREVVARVKAVGDELTGAEPRFLGPAVPINGPAQASRG